MQRAVRLKDIAQYAGVHEATVSAVLSESSRSGTRVSPETAQRIRDLAREHNYRPNRHAQIIRRRGSGTIGIVEFGLSEIAITRSYHVAKHFYEEGVEFQSSNAKWFKESLTKAFYQLIDARVEGIVLVMPSQNIPEEVLLELKKQEIPMVAYNGRPVPGAAQIRSNVEQAMEEMVRHLVGLGYRNLTLLSRWAGPNHQDPGNWMIQERLRGFERSIVQLGGAVSSSGAIPKRAKSGLSGRIHMTNADPLQAKNYYLDGYQAALEILEWMPRPEALICSNDQFAIGVMQAFKKRGISIPEEMAVVGFGNLEVSPYLEIPLTTVDTCPQPDEGKVILQILRKMIAKEPLASDELLIRLPSPLVIRESCGSRLRRPLSGQPGKAASLPIATRE